MKSFKRLVLVFVFVLAPVLFFSASQPANATTIADLQAQISALLAQINALQQQLNQMGGGTAPWCHTFNTNLRVGDSGMEVDMVQTALNMQGLYRNAAATNNFDETFASAVVAFQEKYASEILASYGLTHGTGYVGPTTRAKLNVLYGCKPTVCPTLWDPICGKDGKTYTNDCTLKLAGAVLDYKGQCKQRECKIDIDCPQVCPTCGIGVYCPCTKYKCLDGKCAASSANLPPVISGVSGPTTLNINQTGTWTVNASDPENKSLTYSVVWGDEAFGISSGMSSPNSIYVAPNQTATFTHSYARAGTFTPRFTVTDSAGSTAQTSISVNVGNTTQPFITITSPNGGEVWKIGETQKISWQAIGMTGKILGIGLDGLTEIDANTGTVHTYDINTFLATPTTQSYYLWTIPSNIPPAQYKIKIWNASNADPSKETIDYSDSYFSIVSPENCRYNAADGTNIGSVQKSTVELCRTTWNDFGITRPGSKVYYDGNLIYTY